MDDSFEEAFEEFLEGKEYDQAEEALFAVTRAAFMAGWKAAGGKETIPYSEIRMIRGENRLVVIKKEE